MELETEAQILFEKRGGFRRGFDRVRYGPVLSGSSLYPGGAGIFGIRREHGFQDRCASSAWEVSTRHLDTGAPVPGGGDLDIFYRIIRAGHALVYEPRFLVFHQHRRDMSALPSSTERSWGLGFMCFISKCLKTDPERRPQLIRLIVWWFVNDAT